MVRMFVLAAAALVAFGDLAFAGVLPPAPVTLPEPVSLGLLAVGVGAAVAYRRLRR